MILANTLLAAVLFVGSVPARAVVLFEFQEKGGDVVGILSGAFNFTGIQPDRITTRTSGPILRGNGAFLRTQPFSTTLSQFYTVSGPTMFGDGLSAVPSMSTASAFDLAGVWGELILPVSYVSGTTVSGMMTFNGMTLAGLGIDPGDYVYSLPNDDAIRIRFIAPRPVPLPATLSTFGALIAILGALGWSRRRRILAG